MCHTVMCGLSGSAIRLDTVLQTAGFKEMKVGEQKICVLIFSTNFV